MYCIRMIRQLKHGKRHPNYFINAILMLQYETRRPNLLMNICFNGEIERNVLPKLGAAMDKSNHYLIE